MLPTFMNQKKSKIDTILAQIANLVQDGLYDTALADYRRLYQQSPSFLEPSEELPITKSQATHIHNAANLARRDLIIKTKLICATKRIQESVSALCGVSQKVFDKQYQSPSFLFVPELLSSPFPSVDSVENLRDFVQQLSHHKGYFLSCVSNANEQYIHDIDEVPDTQEWLELAKNWSSLHLMKGGKLTPDGEALPEEIKALLSSPLLADCPEHAPEVVISVLDAKTKIPPHFGISNIKWTLHIPLLVNELSYIEAACEREYWTPDKEMLLFDDSYKHSAENGADEKRAVLILDIWNPHLSIEERSDIKALMEIYSKWSSQYGSLATLDRRLYK